MTITTTSRQAGPFAGTGNAAALPFAFKVFAASDIDARRTIDGVEVELVQGVDYTVTLNADQDATPGGIVNIVASAYPVGADVYITSTVAATQGTSITSQSAFYPKVVENAFDRLTILIQQLKGGVSRALLLPIGENNLVLPTITKRAGKYLGFGTNGELLAIDTSATPPFTVDDAAQISSDVSVLQDILNKLQFLGDDTGSVTRTLNSVLADRVSVKSFGAIGDGALHPLSERFGSLAAAQAVYPHATALTDSIDWAAGQAALNTNRRVWWPHGDYRMNKTLNGGYHCHLEGEVGAARTKLYNTAGLPVLKHAATNEYSTIENLTFDGTGATGIVGNNGYVEYISTLTLRNCHFTKDLAVCLDANFIYLQAHNCTFGYFGTTAHATHRHVKSIFNGGLFTNLNKMVNCKFFNGAATVASIEINAGTMWRFEECDWTLCGRILLATNVSGLIVENCYSEQCAHSVSLFELVTNRTRAEIRGGSHTNGGHTGAFVRYTNDASVLLDTVDIVLSATAFVLTNSGTGSHSLDGRRATAKNCRYQGNPSDPLVANLDDVREGVSRTWTPTQSGFTITGTVTLSGEFSLIGNTVFFAIKATPSGGGTIANGAAGTAYFNLPPGLTPRAQTAAPGVDEVGNTGFGAGLVHVNGRYYPVGFAAQSGNILFSGFYFI
ncbi:hypothetical protein BSL82_10195 [Tardibacter chloracetimidivorans]|uniref:Pectate lyase superfamily protein domain-containing protein n=1 Tax=Tardibacter chloracetimidivorans TaxID=1921510 RepID=A0A1L3ZVJ1_9SPHN|nr:hypothetical protein [Tardibacter chloracetimidivorans]API59643.1 hypothetical protein BSL82_10195 [Tardibacter chloracetimidivorans]